MQIIQQIERHGQQQPNCSVRQEGEEGDARGRVGRVHAPPRRHNRVAVDDQGGRGPAVGPTTGAEGEGEVRAQRAAEEDQQGGRGVGVGAGPQRGRGAQPQGSGRAGQTGEDSPEVHHKGGEGRPARGRAG